MPQLLSWGGATNPVPGGAPHVGAWRAAPLLAQKRGLPRPPSACLPPLALHCRPLCRIRRECLTSRGHNALIALTFATGVGHLVRFRVLVAAAIAAAFVLLPARPALGATFGVTKTADTNDGACNADCSLREAIVAANLLAGDDTITVPAGTYTLTIAGAGEDAAATGDLDITGNLTITGAGAATTIIDAGDLDRVFHVTGVFTATISEVTIRNGSAAEGAGILNGGGTLTLSNSAIMDNVASGQAGGILNQTLATSSLTLNSSTVSGNAAPYGGGISSGGAVTMNGSAVSGNSASIEGGGIYNYLSTVTLNGFSAISDNSAFRGGGIFNNGGTVTLDSSTFSGNSAALSGGGIYNYASGTLILNSSTVSGNTAADTGGGILNNGGTATLNSSTVSGNSATFAGGVFNNAALTLTDATVSGNTASSDGGGMYNGGTATLSGSTVSANSATGGGGIYNAPGGNATLYSSTVSGNVAAYSGGILNAAGAILSLQSNTTISGNTASSEGAGIGNNGTLGILNSTVSGNSAGTRGGGIFHSGEIVAIDGGTVSGNTAVTDGGGVYNDVGLVYLIRGTVAGNSATYGGGIFNLGTLELTDTTVSNNTAYGGGGIVNFTVGSTVTLNSSTVSGNSANQGGGILNDDGAAALSSSTVSGNSALQGGGIYNYGGGTAIHNNTIVANSPSGGNCGGPTAVTSSGYNLSSDATCAFAAIGDRQNTNPLLGPLALNGGPTRTHALLAGSPAAEAGTFGCPATDQRGVARPQGLRCDIGAYEAPDTDLDGVPDPLDLDDDDDTVPDALDSCPLVDEDVDGYQDGDGCPDSDNDVDGICDGGQVSVSCTGSDVGKFTWTNATPGTTDCRNIAEDYDSFHDGDGCPEPDNDYDNFPDYTDDCPGTDTTAGPDGVADTGDEPVLYLTPVQTREDFDGVLDTDGCHDSPGDDYDGDGLSDEDEVFLHGTDPQDPDTDNDGAQDGPDNCRLAANAGQENTDTALNAAGATHFGLPLPADALGDACDSDDDNDAFTDAVELAIGTNPLDNCVAGPGTGGDGWPLDNNQTSIANITDVNAYKGIIPNPVDATHPKRLDLNDSGVLNINDVFFYKGKIPSFCS